MILNRSLGTVLLAAVLGFASLPAKADQVPVAVAANFTAVAEKLAEGFKTQTGHELQLSFGATGALYAQITQGAPFEVFLSADNKRPAQAIKEGFGVEGTAFTYAIGKLVLYSPSVDLSDGKAVLEANAFAHLSIADPAAAPYGAAAVETIKALGLTDALAPKLVTGQSIAQALQFVDSGNAELGFLALSQVIGKDGGSRWDVPADLYSPILQDAVLLKTGENDAAAKAFLDYLKSDEAKTVIQSFGYETR